MINFYDENIQCSKKTDEFENINLQSYANKLEVILRKRNAMPKISIEPSSSYNNKPQYNNDEDEEEGL